MIPPPHITALTLRGILAPLCRGEHVDMCGIVRLPTRLPHTPDWLNWLLKGRHGDLEYMLRDPHGRADPNRVHDWASTLLVFAQRYVNGWSPEDATPYAGTQPGRPWTDGVARYARGADYHDVLRKSIRRIVGELRRELHGRGVLQAEADLRSTDSVDAGPYLEREYAWLAGLGFYGKNTMLIHPKLGSGLFLGVALLNLEVTSLADAPRPLIGPPAQKLPDEGGMHSLCGKCVRCLDACPTDALGEGFDLDAGRCLSNWTIEQRGGTPVADRTAQSGLLFGCDICQAVCPWNHKAMRQLVQDPPGDYAVHEGYGELDLEDLILMDDEAFRRWFRKTPLWRSHPAGMRRNALIVAANTDRTDLEDAVRRAVDEDDDPGVREVAAWALARLKREES